MIGVGISIIYVRTGLVGGTKESKKSNNHGPTTRVRRLEEAKQPLKHVCRVRIIKS